MEGMTATHQTITCEGLVEIKGLAKLKESIVPLSAPQSSYRREFVEVLTMRSAEEGRKSWVRTRLLYMDFPWHVRRGVFSSGDVRV